MKLLVTGGLGFIGSNFVKFILGSRRDLEVTNLDNLSYGSNPDNLRNLAGEGTYRLVEGDISNLELTSKIVADVDVIVNIAAETHVDRSIATPDSFFKSNTLGTYTLLESIRRHSKRDPRFVQVGTDEVYGDLLEGSFSENDVLKPSSPYAASKAAAEMFVMAYHRTYGLRTIVTRCTNNFGPFQFPEKLIPKTIIRSILNLKVPVYGSGKQVRDWIYVTDHCEAIDLIADKGTPGTMYNIAGGNQLENVKLVEAILEILGKTKSLIEHVEDRPGHDARYSLDASRLTNALGWKPRYKFREALRATVSWYLKNENWWKPISDERTLSPTPWKLKW